jgi:subtilisin family serine protease
VTGALLLALVLLAAPAIAQGSKLVHTGGTPIPGQYIVVLAGTELDPVMPADPEPVGPAGPLSAAGPSAATATQTLEEGVPVTPDPTPAPEPAPLPEPGPAPATDPAVAATAGDLTATYGGTSGTLWGEALKGFALQASEAQALAMSQDPRVLFVEEDAVVEGTSVQLNPPWGLDRIDQRARPTDGRFAYTSNGTGVSVYVIDSGIRVSHLEFRDASGINRRAFKLWTDFRDPTDDCNGHGTHVAGIIGGRTYGVAKNVRLYALRVLDCDNHGALSSVVSAVNYVTWIRQQPGQSGIPAVANMSLGFVNTTSSTLDVAVRNSISKRVVYVVAAGNNNVNASTFTPARITEAITVGATDSNDSRASFFGLASNWGPVLDLFAPGKDILSAWNTSDTATLVGSGTSMASPHVAGVAALYLQRFPSAAPATVRNALVSLATTGVVTSAGTGSPNKLLFTNY